MNQPGMRRKIALTTLRSRVRLELRTGMPYSARGLTSIQYAEQWGYTGKRSRKAVLEWLEWELGTGGKG